MASYTTILTEAQDKALSYVSFSQQEWIDNSVQERCRIAIDEIVRICVEKCIEANIQVPGSKDEMVMLAFQNGWVVAAADRPDPKPILAALEGK